MNSRGLYNRFTARNVSTYSKNFVCLNVISPIPRPIRSLRIPLRHVTNQPQSPTSMIGLGPATSRLITCSHQKNFSTHPSTYKSGEPRKSIPSLTRHCQSYHNGDGTRSPAQFISAFAPSVAGTHSPTCCSSGSNFATGLLQTSG